MKCVCGGSFEPYKVTKGAAYARCTVCKVVRLSVIPDDYFQQYEDGAYHTQAAIPYTDRYDHDLLVSMFRYPQLQRMLLPRKVLDVGAANGAFVAYMVMQGWDVTAVEPSAPMREQIYNRTGIRTLASVEEAEARGPYDVVTYFDVLEHVVDVEAEVRRVHGMLQPRGMFWIETPDLASFGPEFESKHIKPKEHVWHFHEAFLVDLLERVGFTVKVLKSTIPGKLTLVAYKSER